MKPRISIYLVVTAVLLILVGGLCIIKPGEAFQSVVSVIGILIFLSGLSSMLFGLRAHNLLPNSGSTTMMAIVQMVIGLLFIAHNILVGDIIVAIFALWVIIEGIALAVLSFDYKRSQYSRWGLMFLLGICSMVLGVIALCHPDGTSIFISILLGLGIIANGVVRLIAFSALKKLKNTVRDIRDSVTAYNIDGYQSKKDE